MEERFFDKIKHIFDELVSAYKDSIIDVNEFKEGTDCCQRLNNLLECIYIKKEEEE